MLMGLPPLILDAVPFGKNKQKKRIAKSDKSIVMSLLPHIKSYTK